METIDLTPVNTEEITVAKFLRMKKSGQLKGIHIDGVVAPQIGKTGSFGTIRIRRDSPIYRPL